MNHRTTFALLVSCTLVAACTDGLDRERLDVSDLDRRIGTISTLQSVDGVRGESDIADDAGRSRESNAPDTASIEKIIGSLSEGRTRPIGLPETRRSTLANNLDLQSVLILPEIAAQQLLAEQAKFQGTFNASVTARRMVSPIAYPPPLSDTRTDRVSIQPSVNVPLRTGGSIDLDWTLQSTRSEVPGLENQAFSSSAPGIRLEQPLLQGGGIAYNEASIVLAESNLGQQRSQAQVAVINELVRSETSYWNLYSAWKMLQVNLQLYGTSRELLENQRRQTDLRNSSIANVYNFEVALAVSAETVLQSELRFRTAIRDLKLSMQNPDIELDSAMTLLPTTEPRLIGYEFDAEKLVKHAIENRADLLELEYETVSRSLEVLMRDNEVLPQLDVLASWNANGFSSSFNSYRKANRDLGEGSEPAGWMVGVNMSVPIGNEIAIANLQAALLARIRSIADLRQRRITVTADVLDAIDALETGWDRILTSRFRVRAAERFYQAYKLLFERGEIPSSNLTQALQSLSSAQIQEVQAEVDYQIQFAKLAQATGCLLGHAGVDWASELDLERFEGPARYPPERGITPDSEKLDGDGPTLESMFKGSMNPKSDPVSETDSDSLSPPVPADEEERDTTPRLPAPKVD